MLILVDLRNMWKFPIGKKNFCASKHRSFLPTVLSRSGFQIPRESASSGLIRSK